MIHAKEALQLDKAKFPVGDKVMLNAVMRVIDKHIRKTMAFMGPADLEIPYRDMSKEVAKTLCHVMKTHGWQVNINLMVAESRFAGGAAQPHHWLLQFQPLVEIYDAILQEEQFRNAFPGDEDKSETTAS